MDWSNLELRKASVLRKEVDAAIRSIQTAVERDDQDKLKKLIDSIQVQINNIEVFYAKNEDDERAILFEKQRLRLRRAIQNVKPASPVKAERYDPSGDASVHSYKQQIHTLSPTHPTTTFSVTDSIRSSNTDVKPLYDWEIAQPVETANERLIQRNEFGSYMPCSEPALYMKSNPEANEDAYIDFQIVLSPEEFNVYASRIKVRKAEMQKSRRAAQNEQGKSIAASTPYVDPKRIQRELYRPAQPDRWVSPTGFRCA